jgi:hypothetical protein
MVLMNRYSPWSIHQQNKNCTWKIMARAPLMLKNLLLNQKLSSTCQERTTLRKFWVQFFSNVNKCHFIITYFISFFFFSIIKVYNGRKFSTNSFGCFNYWTFFSKFINNVSLKLLCKEDPPLWDLEKWDTKESIQKIDQWNNL